MLETELRGKLRDRPILLMTHIVLGYPSFDASFEIVAQMVQAGVDLIELQIPFSEPVADGPVILHANQKALSAGSTVDRCLETAGRMTRQFPIPFLFMTYYNVAYVRGVETFAREASQAGLRGLIVPDLPFEEGSELSAALDREHLDPIFIYSPNTSEVRMRDIAQRARGFVYCVARKGVTGATTTFDTLKDYLERCRRATDLPLAVGFGVRRRTDVEQIVGKAEIAVVGSETIRVVDRDGVGAVGDFIRSLR